MAGEILKSQTHRAMETRVPSPCPQPSRRHQVCDCGSGHGWVTRGAGSMPGGRAQVWGADGAPWAFVGAPVLVRGCEVLALIGSVRDSRGP